MPTGSQRLRRRGAIYHYRRLSAALKEVLNRTYFYGSLATEDPARSRQLARRVPEEARLTFIRACRLEVTEVLTGRGFLTETATSYRQIRRLADGFGRDRA